MTMSSMKIRTHLPRWLGFKYMPNHHYVELEDSDGNRAHLPAHGIMAHVCQDCATKWWTESNMSSHCPNCASQNIQKAWGRLQVAFLPEEETSFSSMPLDTNDIDYDDLTNPGRPIPPEMRTVQDDLPDTDPNLKVGGSAAEVTRVLPDPAESNENGESATADIGSLDLEEDDAEKGD